MVKRAVIESRKVYFDSEGARLAGILRSPASKATEKLPVIIIAPS